MDAAGVPVHREREQRTPAVRISQRESVRQGRLSPLHRQRSEGRRPARRRHEGNGGVCARCPRRGEFSVDLRLTRDDEPHELPFRNFEQVFADRKSEAEAFYASKIPQNLPTVEQAISRQAMPAFCGPSSSTTTSFRTGSTATLNCHCRQRPARSRSIATGRTCSIAMLRVPDKWDTQRSSPGTWPFTYYPDGAHRP